MEVLREKEAKSKNRMPGLVKAGALAMATTVKPHNPTSDRSPSSNDKGVEKLIEKHQTMAPSVEPPIRPRMNTNISPLLIVPSTFLSILFAIFVFKMWKSGDNENQESGANENQESGENENQEQRVREDKTLTCKSEIDDLKEKIEDTKRPLYTSDDDVIFDEQFIPKSIKEDNENQEQRDRVDKISHCKSEIDDLKEKIEDTKRLLLDNYANLSTFDDESFFPCLIDDLKKHMQKLIETTDELVEFCKNDDPNVYEAFKTTKIIIQSMWGDFNHIRGKISPVNLKELLPMKSETEDYLKKAEDKTRKYLKEEDDMSAAKQFSVEDLQNLEIVQILKYKSKIDDLEREIENKTKPLYTSDDDDALYEESFFAKLIKDLNELMRELFDTTDELVKFCKNDDPNVHQAFKTTKIIIQSMWVSIANQLHRLSNEDLKKLLSMQLSTDYYLKKAVYETRKYLDQPQFISAEKQFSMDNSLDSLFRRIEKANED